MTAEEFWDCTPREFDNRVKGFQMKEEREWQRTAQLAAWIMSPHTKRGVDPKKLYNPKGFKKETTPEESKQIVDELIEELGC